MFASLKANSVTIPVKQGQVREMRLSSNGNLLRTIMALEQLIAFFGCCAAHHVTHAKLQQANEGARLSFS